MAGRSLNGEQKHYLGGRHGRFENSGRIAAGTGAIGRGDIKSGALGERAWQAPGPSSGMDDRREKARPSGGKQEPGQRAEGSLGGRLTFPDRKVPLGERFFGHHLKFS